MYSELCALRVLLRGERDFAFVFFDAKLTAALVRPFEKTVVDEVGEHGAGLKTV